MLVPNFLLKNQLPSLGIEPRPYSMLILSILIGYYIIFDQSELLGKPVKPNHTLMFYNIRAWWIHLSNDDKLLRRPLDYKTTNKGSYKTIPSPEIFSLKF